MHSTHDTSSKKTSCGILLDERCAEILVRMATQHGVRRAAGLPGLPSRSLLIRSALRALDRALREEASRARDWLRDAIEDDQYSRDEQYAREHARGEYYFAQQHLWDARRNLKAAPEVERYQTAFARASVEFERARQEAERVLGVLG